MSWEHDPTSAEVERYSAATAAAADPSGLMEQATERYREMLAIRKAGDHEAVTEMARLISDDCLRLCVVPANAQRTAGEKVRFLAIMSKWAWSRRPALAAVMDAAIRAECRTWGEQIHR